MLRRTKIVCTLGPAVASLEGITGLVNAGMDVARLNFSHGEHEDHAQNYHWVREASDATGRAVGILADLQGPKIRLGRFKEGSTYWADGEIVRITVDDVEGTHDRVSTTYKNLADDARPGDRLLVDDGKVGLECIEVDGNDVVCRVIEGGPVSNNKGVSLPGMNISVPALSEKDIVESLEAIILAFDAVMVARGDLGVEVPLEDVPLVQKRAIQIARENAKPVIVATQMLDSMISNSRPTRAEASDVANAVLDGADAVMLSGETSIGKYPQATVKTMARIVTAAEREGEVPALTHMPRTKRGVISYAARDIGERLNARAMVAFTTSGDTARRVARLHSRLPLLVFTPNQQVRSQLALTWGAETFLVREVNSTDEIMQVIDEQLLTMENYNAGDTLVVVAGTPPGNEGNTNMIHVHVIGEDAR